MKRGFQDEIGRMCAGLLWKVAVVVVFIIGCGIILLGILAGR